MMEKSRIAFVIISWNSGAYIRACLDSVVLLKNRYDLSLFLIDNGSSDDTVLKTDSFVLENPDLAVITIRNSTNLGTTRSRNQALKQIRANVHYICILDSDTIINLPAFEKMINTLADSRIMITVPRMFNREKKEQCSVKRFPTAAIKLSKGIPVKWLNRLGGKREEYEFCPDRRMPAFHVAEGWSLSEGQAHSTDRVAISNSPAYSSDMPPFSTDSAHYPVDYAISACWLMRREALDIVGLFDEKIFYAPEDVDYCARIRESGLLVSLTSDASIYHLTQRISRDKLISWMNWLHVKGLIYYFIKHRYCFSTGRLSEKKIRQ